MIRVRGETPFGREVRKGHVLFLLGSADLDAVCGPLLPTARWNLYANGVPLLLRDPALSEQMLRFDDTSVARVRGLPPSRYVVRAFPDDFVFEPVEFTLSQAESRIELTWRPR